MKRTNNYLGAYIKWSLVMTSSLCMIRALMCAFFYYEYKWSILRSARNIFCTYHCHSHINMTYWGVWYRSAGANLFWRMGHSRMVCTLATAVTKYVWYSRDAGSKQCITPWSKLLKKLAFTMLPVHGDMSSWYSIQNDIYTPTLGARSSVVNCSLPARLTVLGNVWYRSSGGDTFWRMGHCWMVSKLVTSAGDWTCLCEVEGPDSKNASPVEANRS